MSADKDQEIARLRALVRMGADVVNDFLPNIGRCVLQDYGRMNTFLVRAAEVSESSSDKLP